MLCHRRSASRLVVAVLTMLAAALSLAVAVQPSASAAAARSSVAAAGSPAPNNAAGTDTTVTLTVQGVARTYTVFVPSKLPVGPRPLLVALHWYSGSAASAESVFGFDAGAAANGVLVVYPQGIGATWDAGTCCGQAQQQHVDDVTYLNAVLTDVEARYDVDTAKIAMGGYSNGGMMAYRYLCSGTNRVSTYFIGSAVAVPPSCRISNPANVLAFHGLVDTTVPWLGTRTSPFTATGILPSVPSSDSGIAAVLGCTGWGTQPISTLVTRYTATCPTGSSFTILTSATMPHHWATGAADFSTYGLDETGATWSFVLGHWAAVRS